MPPIPQKEIRSTSGATTAFVPSTEVLNAWSQVKLQVNKPFRSDTTWFSIECAALPVRNNGMSIKCPTFPAPETPVLSRVCPKIWHLDRVSYLSCFRKTGSRSSVFIHPSRPAKAIECAIIRALLKKKESQPSALPFPSGKMVLGQLCHPPLPKQTLVFRRVCYVFRPTIRFSAIECVCFPFPFRNSDYQSTVLPFPSKKLIINRVRLRSILVQSDNTWIEKGRFRSEMKSVFLLYC